MSTTTRRPTAVPDLISINATADATASADAAGSTNPPPEGATPAAAPALDQIASGLRDQFNAWIAAIPDLEVSHPPGRKSLQAASSIPFEFVSAAEIMVQSSAALQELKRFNAATSRNAADYEAQFKAIVWMLQGAAVNLQYTIDRKKAAAVAQALQIYHLAKGLERDKPGGLRPYLEIMKKTLGRRGNRRRAANPPEPATAPDTPPASTPPAIAPASVTVTATIPATRTTTRS